MAIWASVLLTIALFVVSHLMYDGLKAMVRTLIIEFDEKKKQKILVKDKKAEADKAALIAELKKEFIK